MGEVFIKDELDFHCVSILPGFHLYKGNPGGAQLQPHEQGWVQWDGRTRARGREQGGERD